MENQAYRGRARRALGTASLAVLAATALVADAALAERSDAARDMHQQGLDAFNAHDAGAVSEVYAEDAVLHDPALPEPAEGRAAIAQVYEGWITAFPDTRATLLNLVAQDDLIMYDIRLEGTHDGPLATPEGEIPATGAEVDMRVAVIAQVDEEGRFRDTRRYSDTAVMARQLGLED